MSYQLRIKPEVQREIRSLPAYVRSQAVALIDTLLTDPRPPRAKELRDKPGIFRIWLAGRWRIVYKLDEEDQLVIILRVRLKEDIDYGSI